MQSHNLITMLFFIVPFLLFIPFTIYAFKRKGMLIEEWTAAGQRLGIGDYTTIETQDMRRPSGGLRGTLRGLPVRVYWEQRGSGKNSYTVTVFQVELDADAPIGLHISNEGMLAKASKLIGAQDIQIGDAAFDKTFMIKAADAYETRQYFGPAHRREALLELRSLKGTSYGITDGVIFSELHSLVNGATLEAHLLALVALAQRHIHGDAAPPQQW